jgi:uncharacterized membrane protein
VESRAKLFGHPIHPILIPFPLGLLVTSFIFDIIYLVTDNDAFSVAAFWMIAAGVIGGLAVAVFGIIDFSRVPDAQRVSWKRPGVHLHVPPLLTAQPARLRTTPSKPGTQTASPEGI